VIAVPVDDGRVSFTAEEAKLRIQESLRASEERPLYSGTSVFLTSVVIHIPPHIPARSRMVQHTPMCIPRALRCMETFSPCSDQNSFCQWIPNATRTRYFFVSTFRDKPSTHVFRQQYQEVTIPPAKAVPPRLNERLIPVNELDILAGGCFPVCMVKVDATGIIE
jgi:hypothetical protein